MRWLGIRLGLPARTATFLATVFAVLPFGVEALVWNSAFTYVLCVSFALLLFATLIRYAEGRSGTLFVWDAERREWRVCGAAR